MLPALQVADTELKMQWAQDAFLYGGKKNTAMQVVMQLMECVSET